MPIVTGVKRTEEGRYATIAALTAEAAIENTSNDVVCVVQMNAITPTLVDYQRQFRWVPGCTMTSDGAYVVTQTADTSGKWVAVSLHGITTQSVTLGAAATTVANGTIYSKTLTVSADTTKFNIPKIADFGTNEGVEVSLTLNGTSLNVSITNESGSDFTVPATATLTLLSL
jgi:hypothetical protein